MHKHAAALTLAYPSYVFRLTPKTGTGTLDDPLTFASDPNEYTPCEVIYLPYLKKYLRMEDECEQCSMFASTLGRYILT